MEGVAQWMGLDQKMWNMDEWTPTSLKNLTEVGQMDDGWQGSETPLGEVGGGEGNGWT